jgi:hypothetical protein
MPAPLTDPMEDIAASLAPSLETIAAEAEAGRAEEQDENTARSLEQARRRREQRAERWTFDFPSPEAKLPPQYAGRFTSVIPTLQARQNIGIMRARLGGGLPFEALDPYTREVNLIVSTLFHVLDRESKDFPEWAKNLQAVKHIDVLYALFAEVSSHEETFFGR